VDATAIDKTEERDFAVVLIMAHVHLENRSVFLTGVVSDSFYQQTSAQQLLNAGCGRVFNCVALRPFLLCAQSDSIFKNMPRVKTESLQEGMVVSADVKNIDNMLLIPSGCTLTARQIGILQAWGVTDIDVKASGDAENLDALAAMPADALERLTAEVRAGFWKADDADPVFAELFKVILRRRANRPRSK